MLKFNNPDLARRLAKIASAVGMAETRVAIARDDLKLYAAHVPAVAEALQYLEPAASLLEPLFDELHKIIHDPACAGITLSAGAKGQQPPESGQGPAADTQSASEHKSGSAVSLSTLSGLVRPGAKSEYPSRLLSEILREAEPLPESEFESECPMFAQVANLTEQVTTLQNDVKTLVDLNRELYDGLRVLGELVIGRAVAKSN